MRQNLKLSSLQLWCKYQGGPWTQQSCIQLCSRQLGAGGIAATEGQCCSSAGATRWNMGNRSSGSSMYVPHVITICSARIHSSVNKLTNNISIVSADCQHASAHVHSSPVSLPSPLTVKQPRPPGSCRYRSKQFFSDILSRRGHGVFLRQR